MGQAIISNCCFTGSSDSYNFEMGYPDFDSDLSTNQRFYKEKRGEKLRNENDKLDEFADLEEKFQEVFSSRFGGGEPQGLSVRNAFASFDEPEPTPAPYRWFIFASYKTAR